MSHFTVLIIGDDYEEKLEPYDENMSVDPYVDMTAEELQKDKDETLANYRLGERQIPNDMTIAKLDAMSLAEFAEWYHSQKVDGENNLLSEYNPDSKWDFYTLGGRWRGMLIPKHGKTGEMGKAGSFDNEPINKNGVDQALFEDIDWKKTNSNAETKKALKEYWDRTISGKGIYKPEYLLERYGTKEEYVRRGMLFTTHAVITKDGEWHEVGHMGWFGCSSESHDEQKDWDENFWNMFLKGLKPDTLISIVDCHI
jgi:hypothetical protein